MSCNKSNDFPPAVSVVGAVSDGYKESIGANVGVGKYAKLGNILTVTQIAAHANNGEWENVAQDIGVAAATTALGLALAPITTSVLAVTAVTVGAGLALNYVIDKIQCDEPDKDPTDPFTPDPDDSNNKDYRIEYYDPVILDLNGNGVKTVNKNGYFGALFDHDGIRTATGWVAKEDGLLVRDINGNGKIDNGTELFGNNTILENGKKATNEPQDDFKLVA